MRNPKDRRSMLPWRRVIPVALAVALIGMATPAVARQFNLRAETTVTRAGQGNTTGRTGTQNPWGQGPVHGTQVGRSVATSSDPCSHRPQTVEDVRACAALSDARRGIARGAAGQAARTGGDPCSHRPQTAGDVRACAAISDARRRAEIAGVRTGASAQPIRTPIIRVPTPNYQGSNGAAALGEAVSRGITRTMPRNGTRAPNPMPRHAGGFR